MNVLPKHKEIQVLSAMVEGNSIRSIERMTGIHRDTIMRKLVRAGSRAAEIMDEKMRDLPCRSVQIDEIWTFCKRKQNRLSTEQRQNPEYGDQYVFTALCADTRLIPVFEIGKRNGDTARKFLDNLRTRVPHRFQLSSDAFIGYTDTVGWVMPEAVDYAQVIKIYESQHPGPGRYAPPRVSEVISKVIHGNPNTTRISTSLVERSNLSIRTMCRRFTRLSLGFSKKLENLQAAVNLTLFAYNFVRQHRTLRVSPAMAAGVADTFWSLESLVG